MMWHKKASLTIELSLLFPGILAMLVLIIFTGFFVHDKCIIMRMTYEMASGMTQNGKHEYEGVVNIQSENNIDLDEIENSLAWMWDLSADYSETEDERIIHVKGTMRAMNGVLLQYLSDIVYKIDIEQRILKITGPEYIRRERK